MDSCGSGSACFIWTFRLANREKLNAWTTSHRNRAFIDQIRRRPAGTPQRRSHAGAGPRPLHRRRQPAGPGLCRDGAQPRGPWRHPLDRHRRRQGHAGRARGADRGGSCRLWRAQMHAAAEEPRRLADPLRAAAGAGGRQGALRRRSGRLRDRRNRRAGQGRRRGGRARHRAAQAGAQAGRRGQTRRAAGVRPNRQQHRARFSLRRCRKGRRGVRQSQARDAAGDFQPAHGGQRHGAACRHRRIRRRGGQVDALFVEPRRARLEDRH